MNEVCFTDSCQVSLPQCLVTEIFLNYMCDIGDFAVNGGLYVIVLLSPLARRNGAGDFITSALMWCRVSILSTLLCYRDLMESHAAELALAALRLRRSHCGPLYSSVLIRTPAWCCLLWRRKETALDWLYFMNEWGNGIWKYAQDKRCLVCVSALLCPSYSHDW